MRASIVETLPMHTSRTFEDICREALRSPAFPVACSRVGRWWYDGEEIDVVVLDPQSDTLLPGECKWTAHAVGTGLLDDLEALTPTVRWHGSNRTVEYAPFARSGFSKNIQALEAEREDRCLYTPTDLVSLLEVV